MLRSVDHSQPHYTVFSNSGNFDTMSLIKKLEVVACACKGEGTLSKEEKKIHEKKEVLSTTCGLRKQPYLIPWFTELGLSMSGSNDSQCRLDQFLKNSIAAELGLSMILNAE
eukprot:scaffold21566_cov73-Cyclotella_meneghiniana.AAC.8